MNFLALFFRRSRQCLLPRRDARGCAPSVPSIASSPSAFAAETSPSAFAAETSPSAFAAETSPSAFAALPAPSFSFSASLRPFRRATSRPEGDSDGEGDAFDPDAAVSRFGRTTRAFVGEGCRVDFERAPPAPFASLGFLGFPGSTGSGSTGSASVFASVSRSRASFAFVVSSSDASTARRRSSSSSSSPEGSNARNPFRRLRIFDIARSSSANAASPFGRTRGRFRPSSVESDATLPRTWAFRSPRSSWRLRPRPRSSASTSTIVLARSAPPGITGHFTPDTSGVNPLRKHNRRQYVSASISFAGRDSGANSKAAMAASSGAFSARKNRNPRNCRAASSPSTNASPLPGAHASR